MAKHNSSPIQLLKFVYPRYSLLLHSGLTLFIDYCSSATHGSHGYFLKLKRVIGVHNKMFMTIDCTLMKQPTLIMFKLKIFLKIHYCLLLTQHHIWKKEAFWRRHYNLPFQVFFCGVHCRCCCCLFVWLLDCLVGFGCVWLALGGSVSLCLLFNFLRFRN